MRPGDGAAMSRRATSQARTKGPRRFVPMTWSMSSFDILVAYWASGMPALLTRMVTRPSSDSARATPATI